MARFLKLFATAVGQVVEFSTGVPLWVLWGGIVFAFILLSVALWRFIAVARSYTVGETL